MDARRANAALNRQGRPGVDLGRQKRYTCGYKIVAYSREQVSAVSSKPRGAALGKVFKSAWLGPAPGRAAACRTRSAGGLALRIVDIERAIARRPENVMQFQVAKSNW